MNYFKFILFFISLLIYSDLSGQGSNTCAGAAANQITLPFFTNNQTTCGDLNDYNGVNACAVPNTGNNYGGQDWIYSFTPTQNGYVTITLNDIVAGGQVYPTISLLSACPGTAGACLGFFQCSPFFGGGFFLNVFIEKTLNKRFSLVTLSLFNFFGFFLIDLKKNKND